MDSRKLGIRGLLRISVCITLLVALPIFATKSKMNVTNDELARAEASMNDELTYLCLQLEAAQNRMRAFDSLASSSGVTSQELEVRNPEASRILTDPIGDVLAGYSLAVNGTVLIADDDEVIVTDDWRVPFGGSMKELLGGEVCAAIDASIQSGRMQTIPYRGVFDAPGGEGAYGDRDDEAYVLAKRQGDYTILGIEPSSMDFRERAKVIGREVVLTYVILTVVFAIMSRLLNRMVLRPIDNTNEALRRITSGELECRIDEDGAREFIALASGINTTVDALEGWIREAETRMDSELSAARAIQESALPRDFPPFPSIQAFDIYAIMNAAKEVGGDFYDFFLIGGDKTGSEKLVFLIADVSGKGIPAALFMMKAMAQVRKELEGGVEIGQAIQNANKDLAVGNTACMFVTMWVGVLDYGTGHMEYVNAGHNAPLCWQGDEGWIWLKEKSGIPLGTPIDRPYKAHRIECCAGDKFLLYTDGVTEAKNNDGDMYGEDRLMTVASANQVERPEALVTAVRGDIASFVQDAEQFDDITILALDILAPDE